jgi:hypothetical protein
MEATMRRLTILVALALAFAVSATEAAKPTAKPARAAKPVAAKTQTPKGGAAKGASIKAPKGSTVKTTGTQAKVSAGKSVKPAEADVILASANGKAAKTETKTTNASLKTNKKTGSSSIAITSTDTIDFTATRVGQQLEKNGAIRSKIEAKLLAAGYTGSVYEAAYGIKNLGQLNAMTNQVQNHGYSFELLKVLMTGTYVDPETHVVYRANRLPDGTVQLVGADLATNPVSALSLGQAQQAIKAGAEMPDVILVSTTEASSGSL